MCNGSAEATPSTTLPDAEKEINNYPIEIKGKVVLIQNHVEHKMQMSRGTSTRIERYVARDDFFVIQICVYMGTCQN
jgi:hypothetical protein